MAKFCTRCGKPLDQCTCGGTSSYHPSNRMTAKDFFGLRESDVDKSADCFEYGKKIVPDVVDLCDGEIPIKQYEMGRIRKRSSLSWSNLRIQVTNKRLIQRTVGRSLTGKDVFQDEYAIDDIVGVQFSKGRQFSWGDFFLLFFLSYIVFYIGSLILGIFIRGSSSSEYDFIYKMQNVLQDTSEMPGFVTAFPIFLFIAYLVFVIYCLFYRKYSNNFLFSILAGFCAGFSVFAGTQLYLFFSIASLVFQIRFALLPSINVIMKTKSMQGTGANMLTKKGIVSIKVGSIVLPSKDTDTAIKELGAMITDIQKLGDFAIEKWQA